MERRTHTHTSFILWLIPQMPQWQKLGIFQISHKYGNGPSSNVFSQSIKKELDQN